MINKEKFEREIKLFDEYLKSRKLDYIEEVTLLNAMLDFARDNRTIDLLQSLYNMKRKKEK